MKNQNNSFFIVCANNKENEIITELNYLGLSWKETVGCYKGIPERSFLIVNNDLDVENVVRNLARKYSQESYLKVLNDNVAYLVFPHSAAIEKIGEWKQVDKHVALQETGYTVDPTTGYYYTVL